MENRVKSIYEVGILIGDDQSDKLKFFFCYIIFTGKYATI